MDGPFYIVSIIVEFLRENFIIVYFFFFETEKAMTAPQSSHFGALSQRNVHRNDCLLQRSFSSLQATRKNTCPHSNFNRMKTNLLN
jgi:hypothetical protein